MIFVVDYRREQRRRSKASRPALFGDRRPADSLVGAPALSHPEYPIDVEAIAAFDGRRRGEGSGTDEAAKPGQRPRSTNPARSTTSPSHHGRAADDRLST
jgi:hypothetical protein